MTARCQAILEEIGAALAGLDRDALDRAVELIAEARRIVLYGCGREGLQVKGLAMRLFHLGLDVGVQGEMTAPPLGAGDLFVASAGPGELSTVTALMRVAKDAGASVLFLTACPGTPSAALADRVLAIPAQTMASDRRAGAGNLPMGSAYEGALFVVFEALVLELRDRLRTDAEAMRARHTNME